MKTIDKNRRKFHYPKNHQEEYEKLLMGTERSDKIKSGNNRFFSTKKDIFIFSALLGYKMKERKKFSEKIAFTAEFGEYAPIIYSIALDSVKEKKGEEKLTLLKVENDIFQKDYIENLIEEYACGGFEILKKKLNKKGKDPLELFENLIEECLEGTIEVEVDLENFSSVL